MPKKEKYRLQPLVLLKEKAKRQTETALARAIRGVKEEEERLVVLEEKKKEIFRQIARARLGLGDKIATGQSRIRESQFHLGFIQKLKDDGEAIDKEIEEQKEAVTRAKDKLKRARRDYMDAAHELNVMEKHKELWVKKQKAVLEEKENKLMNELGNVIFQINKVRAE